MKEIWLTVERIANLLGVSKRSVQKAIKKGKYRTKGIKSRGHKGLRWVVALSSLGADGQLKYYQEAIAEPLRNQKDLLGNSVPQSENKGVTDQDWLTVAELSSAMKITERAVRKKLTKGEFSKVRKIEGERGGNAGIRYEVHVSSLPKKIQLKVQGFKGSSLNRGDAEGRREESQSASGGLHSIGEGKRKVALARYVLLQGFGEFNQIATKESLHSIKGESETARLRYYVNTYYKEAKECEGLREVLGDSVSLNTFYRWKRLYKEKGVIGLVPQWEGKKASLTEEEEEELKELWGQKTRPSMQFAYRAYLRWCKGSRRKARDYDVCRRFLRSLPEAWVVLHREGKEAYEKKVAPYLEMDMSKARSNQFWSSDHKQLDVNVIVDGVERKFAWVTLWIDEASRKIMGFVIDRQWSGETILGSFRDAAVKYGVPEHVRIDRGKDYRSVRVQGLLAELGITVHYCIPYRPQSKGKVERLFRFVDDDFSKYFRANRGRSPAHRREDFSEIVKDDRNLVTIVELDRLFGAWAQWYNERKHQGLKGRTPNQVYEEKLISVRKIDARQLDLLMMVAREKTVGRNGVRIFNTWYMGEGLSLYFRQKVQVRYDMHNIDEVLVYDESGKFICRARRWKPVDATSTSEAEYKEAKRVKKRELELLKEAGKIEKEGKFMLKPLERIDEETKRQIEEDVHRGDAEEQRENEKLTTNNRQPTIEVPEEAEAEREAAYRSRMELVDAVYSNGEIENEKLETDNEEEVADFPLLPGEEEYLKRLEES